MAKRKHHKRRHHRRHHVSGFGDAFGILPAFAALPLLVKAAIVGGGAYLLLHKKPVATAATTATLTPGTASTPSGQTPVLVTSSAIAPLPAAQGV